MVVCQIFLGSLVFLPNYVVVDNVATCYRMAVEQRAVAFAVTRNDVCKVVECADQRGKIW